MDYSDPDRLPEKERPIVIVGAGLSGLAAAIQCALSGHTVVVLESAKQLAAFHQEHTPRQKLHLPVSSVEDCLKAIWSQYLIAAAESLTAEVAHLNIRVLNVLPGGMKTCSWDKMTLLPTSPNALLPVPSDQHSKPDEANDSEENSENPPSKGITRPDEEHIPDYAELRERQVKWMRSAVCDGDPDKCGQAIYNIIAGENTESNDSRSKWPEGNMLVLGEDAGNNIRDKCDTVLRNLDEWKEVIRGVAADQ